MPLASFPLPQPLTVTKSKKAAKDENIPACTQNIYLRCGLQKKCVNFFIFTVTTEQNLIYKFSLLNYMLVCKYYFREISFTSKLIKC